MTHWIKSILIGTDWGLNWRKN